MRERYPASAPEYRHASTHIVPLSGTVFVSRQSRLQSPTRSLSAPGHKRASSHQAQDVKGVSQVQALAPKSSSVQGPLSIHTIRSAHTLSRRLNARSFNASQQTKGQHMRYQSAAQYPFNRHSPGLPVGASPSPKRPTRAVQQMLDSTSMDQRNDGDPHAAERKDRKFGSTGCDSRRDCDSRLHTVAQLT